MQVEACKILKRLDLKVFVTDANREFACKPWVDDFDVVDTYDIQRHLEIARTGKASKLDIAGVACIATDCHETVAALSNELALPGITPSLSREIGNKIAVRKRNAEILILVFFISTTFLANYLTLSNLSLYIRFGHR